MLGIFKSGLVNPPKELNSPVSSSSSSSSSKHPDEILKDFMCSHHHHHENENENGGFSMGFIGKALIAHAPPPSSQRSSSFMSPQRLFSGIDEIYCMFVGRLDNLSELNKQYGLSKLSNEAAFVIEAYRTLRDRGPYPAHRVLNELQGSFGFFIYDHKAATVFAALGAYERVQLFWGIAADGSLVFSDNVDIVKASCGKSFAPFPTGCMYHSEEGLGSFEHPTKKMKAMPRVDSEGVMCGANFKVDVCSKVHTMPRVGSEANWATWGGQHT